MITPRLRIIAGPNGSGKTTLTRYLIHERSLSFGIYINADDIEQRLYLQNRLDFSGYGLLITEKSIKDFFVRHPLNTGNGQETFSVRNNQLQTAGVTDGYFAAILSDYLRRMLMEKRSSFSFETVMSGKDKIGLMRDAHKNGYRNYLYYICTDDVLINKERVAGRVLMGEHTVPEDKIVSRYYRSLELLFDAIKATDRAYLFDNSGQSHELIAEVTDGAMIDIKKDLLPNWFVEAIIKKVDT